MQPVSWAPAALESWRVDLRCPNCEWTGRAIAPQDEVDDFDVILDVAAEQLNRALLTALSPAIDTELDRLLSSNELPSQRR